MGELFKISGPVVVAEKMQGAKIHDLVRVGNEKLLGEIIRLNDDRATIQVYEDTSGLRPGEKIENTGLPLSVELGPGLLQSIYDGIQRPLEIIKGESGDFIKRGVVANSLDRKKKWEFSPKVKKGQAIQTGDTIGTVQETAIIEHRIMAPPGMKGTVESISSGKFTVEETVCVLKDGKTTHKLSLMHKWNVKTPRPYARKFAPTIPLITGQRILDTFFPVAKGGAAAIPGPFGSGKCVSGDTTVLVNNELAEIQTVFEKELYNTNNTVDSNEHETIIKLKEPLKVFSFNGKEITENLATHLYSGKTSSVVEVRTRSGKKARLTPVHKLFRLNEKLEIEETRAMDLRQGDYLISPRKIPFEERLQEIKIDFDCRVTDEDAIMKMKQIINEKCAELGMTKKQLALRICASYHSLLAYYLERNKPTLDFIQKIENFSGQKIVFHKIKTERHSNQIKVPEYLDEEFAELVGFLMSDGSTKGGRVIEFYNNKKELRERVKYLLKKVFGLESKDTYARTVEAVSTTSTAAVRILHSLGFPLRKKSRNVCMPVQLLASPKNVSKAFLNAYIPCDGHISENDIEISTASKKMQTGLSYLLAKLSILHKASEKTTNGAKYYRIFIPPKEANKISQYYNKKYYYTSTDIVPMTPGLFRQILQQTKPWELQKKGISTISYYKELNQTTHTFQQVIKELGITGSMAEFAQALEHVFCDEIVEVKEINEPQTVYDLTVPHTHNFVSGNQPMILHNTVTQQQLAKWSDANVIVYVGCGERGNEMTEVLTEFPELVDPKTGKPLMERTVLIANTSNMPVAAREASVYTGITIAEYYRDMGYDVALMADSTSRWAEAMREISGRLEEMPGEEGYPAYLARRLAEFYERAGRVVCMGQDSREGSVSTIGAVSPPGGDISEPVSQNTLRVTKVFWALDAKLAQRRHFPAINWLKSYSLYLDTLEEFYTNSVSSDFVAMRTSAMALLQKESELQEIVQLVGPDALPEKEQEVLNAAKMIREDFLQQSAYHEVDTYSSLHKQYLLLGLIMKFHEKAEHAIDNGVQLKAIRDVKVKEKISRFKEIPESDVDKKAKEISNGIESEFDSLAKSAGR